MCWRQQESGIFHTSYFVLFPLLNQSQTMTNIYNSFQEWTQLLTERHFLFILWFSSVSLPLCTKCWLVGSPHLWALQWRDSLPASGTHSGMPGSQDCTTDQYNHWSTSRSCYSLYHNRHLREGKYFTHQFGRKPDWSIFIGDVNPKWFALEVYKISPQTCKTPTADRQHNCLHSSSEARKAKQDRQK